LIRLQIEHGEIVVLMIFRDFNTDYLSQWKNIRSLSRRIWFKFTCQYLVSVKLWNVMMACSKCGDSNCCFNFEILSKAQKKH
jgi:hypothetical protein